MQAYSYEARAQAVSLFNQGLSRRNIARSTGIPYSTIRNWFLNQKNNSYKPPQGKRKHRPVVKIMDLSLAESTMIANQHHWPVLKWSGCY